MTSSGMIAAENPDGSEKLVVRMDSAEFLEDIATLVGYVEPSAKEKTQFSAGLGLR